VNTLFAEAPKQKKIPVMVNKNASIIGQGHSAYGRGVELRVRF